jgi:hypothetical protein
VADNWFARRAAQPSGEQAAQRFEEWYETSPSGLTRYEIAELAWTAALGAARREQEPRPKVVCLCGSTRFYEAFMRANYDETMAGHIVLSVGFFLHRPDTAHGQTLGCTPEQKIALDELHKRKIDLADEVFVLNVGGYIGSSTRSEIDYALAHSKPIRYLEITPGAEGK